MPRSRQSGGGVYARRRLGLLSVVALVAGAVALAAGHGRSREPATGTASIHGHARRAFVRSAPPVPKPAPPALTVSAPGGTSTGWRTVAVVHGHPAAWLSQSAGVTLMRFDQRFLRLDLHAGSSDGGTAGWSYGDRVTAGEIHHLVAAFNGGFKLTYPNVGFMSAGHVAAPLRPGLASIVTYSDGTTDVGAWRAGVPRGHSGVFSVLQNQRLLVDHGSTQASPSGCVSCWGETIGGRTVVARSALGITAGGDLVWAAGEQLLPSQLAGALVRAGAVRAIELDINPDWVDGYLYVHHRGGPSAVPVVPGQLGIAGELLEPYSRDFLTIVA